MQVLKRVSETTRQFFLMGALVVGALGHLAWAGPDRSEQRQLGNDEDSFVFAGTCFNGRSYRLHFFQNHADGLLQPFYEYTGPAGKGVVQSDTPPKVMVARVCRQEAEIINARYWE